jgi:hypothetical protein
MCARNLLDRCYGKKPDPDAVAELDGLWREVQWNRAEARRKLELELATSDRLKQLFSTELYKLSKQQYTGVEHPATIECIAESTRRLIRVRRRRGGQQSVWRYLRFRDPEHPCLTQVWRSVRDRPHLLGLPSLDEPSAPGSTTTRADRLVAPQSTEE